MAGFMCTEKKTTFKPGLHCTVLSVPYVCCLSDCTLWPRGRSWAKAKADVWTSMLFNASLYDTSEEFGHDWHWLGVLHHQPCYFL